MFKSKKIAAIAASAIMAVSAMGVSAVSSSAAAQIWEKPSSGTYSISFGMKPSSANGYTSTCKVYGGTKVTVTGSFCSGFSHSGLSTATQSFIAGTPTGSDLWLKYSGTTASSGTADIYN